MSEIIERHTMLFSDVAVSVEMDDDGEVSVYFTSPTGRRVFSFNSLNWESLVAFVENSQKVTA